jgi:hypothetical protein
MRPLSAGAGWRTGPAGALPGNGICWADAAALMLRTVKAATQAGPARLLGLQKPGIFSRPS